MSTLRKIVGIIVMILGVLLGLFLSIGVLECGGMIQIIKSANPIDEVGIAIGAIKMSFSWLGYIIGAIIWTLGDMIRGE